MRVLQQIGITLLGLVIAGVMVVLGIWQLGVYRDQGDRTAQDRANGPVIALADVARAGQEVGDAYGRPVSTRGTFDPALQVLVGRSDGPFRVLTGLRLGDGSVVPVVRGTVSSALGDVPAPPTGEVDVQGIFMPSEAADPGPMAETEQFTTVLLPALAQQWRPPLVSGFITERADASTAQGLGVATVTLPEAKGRLRNGAYGIQWFVFAAFAVAFALKLAYDLGRVRDLELLELDEDRSPQEDASETARG